jgi:hypothetical protein
MPPVVRAAARITEPILASGLGKRAIGIVCDRSFSLALERICRPLGHGPLAGSRGRAARQPCDLRNKKNGKSTLSQHHSQNFCFWLCSNCAYEGSNRNYLIRIQAQLAGLVAFYQFVMPAVAAIVVGNKPDHFFGIAQLQLCLGFLAVARVRMALLIVTAKA